MNPDQLKALQIEAGAKRRPTGGPWMIFLGVVAVVAVTAFFAWPRESDRQRLAGGKPKDQARGALPVSVSATNSAKPAVQARVDGSVLTVSGYIITRERIELSPRFMGVVKWIGVKKGDAVKKGQLLVQLDDAEYKARLAETGARIANAKAARATAEIAVPDSEARLAQAAAHLAAARATLSKAELDFQRAETLVRQKAEAKQLEDDTRLRLDGAREGLREADALLTAAKLAPNEARSRLSSAEAALLEAEASHALAQLYLDWTTIRSPIDGVVLEKLVHADELVVPQSFGGPRAPSTALVALADPDDLQVEIDLNEADIAKVFLKQRCRISPEAYPDKGYDGFVAEIAPEASRAKGTLQVKVQIVKPDRYLTPELSAKVDFIGAMPPANAATGAKVDAAK
ncbi:MAG: efflux RND transporter periplasmic adaptor subunit [Verrucomicrobia bacterium]|nr:efflux RND transporter periplasmic adaptor subunit [Verrucomicrobiota bacterium]